MKKLKFNKKGLIATLAIASILGFYAPTTALAATTPPLGAASTFSILAQSGITGTGTISGNVENNGIAAAITGLTTAMVAGYTIYSTDGGNTTGTPPAPTTVRDPAVQADASAAYTVNIPGQGTNGTIVGNLDAQTFTPGVYDQGAILLAGGTVTLDGAGVYIFRSASTLTSAGTVNLINGARACDVFWRVQTSADINGTSFVGTILAGAGVHFGPNVTLDGRALAVGTDVTLNTGAIILGPSCAVTPPAPAVSGGVFVNRPLIDIVKVPNPLALPAGPGSVTFNYTVTNIGKVAISGVTVKDDKCSPVNIVTGDTNRNGMLDVGSSWTYRCTKTVTKTEMNTATVHGQAYGWDAYDTANATVVVGASLVPPLIHLVKVPNKFTLPYGGGAVSYAYNVTNPGTVPLSNVSITDDKCTGLPTRVAGHPGDLNKNGLLDTNETFYFICATNLTKTTTNVGTASGQANGLTAIDYAQATVAVSPAKLPNTGFGPEDKSLMNILVPAGVLALLLSFYISRRKRTV